MRGRRYSLPVNDMLGFVVLQEVQHVPACLTTTHSLYVSTSLRRTLAFSPSWPPLSSLNSATFPLHFLPFPSLTSFLQPPPSSHSLPRHKHSNRAPAHMVHDLTHYTCAVPLGRTRYVRVEELLSHGACAARGLAYCGSFLLLT